VYNNLRTTGEITEEGEEMIPTREQVSEDAVSERLTGEGRWDNHYEVVVMDDEGNPWIGEVHRGKTETQENEDWIGEFVPAVQLEKTVTVWVPKEEGKRK
jgi:hypothetical protein